MGKIYRSQATIIIRSAETKDINDIVDLHFVSLPDTRSSKMGKGYLTFLYQQVFAFPMLHYCFVAVHNKKIVGAITVSRSVQETQQIMTSSLFPWGIKHIVQAIVSGKISILELIEQMRFEHEIGINIKPPYTSILTLFVDPSVQRQGIGKKLINQLSLLLIKEGVKRLYVDTQLSNRRAQDFYKSVGFKEEIKIRDSLVFLLSIKNT